MECDSGVAREREVLTGKYEPWDFFIPMAFFV
jgi:hypothetical protein